MSEARGEPVDPAVADVGPGPAVQVGTLSALNVYPVKSLKGLPVDRWTVGPTGLLYDRHWMVVDSRGRQLTQRELPRLCLIEPSLGPDQATGAVKPEALARNGVLTLSSAGAGSVSVAVTEPGAVTTVRVWDDEVEATGCGAEVAGWLSDFLEVEARLVRFAGAETVAGRPWQRVAFPDSLPFLLIGQGSLDDLNHKLRARGRAEVTMDRFRPNLVVAGSPPFAEDGWRRVSLGGLGFAVRKPCARCVVTTIEQATASVGREPLASLSRYRTSGGKVMFGQKLIHDGPGELAVGARVGLYESVPADEALRFEER